MLVEVEEDDSNVTFALDDNAWFKLLLQHYIQGNPLVEVNKDISIVTLADDDSAPLLLLHLMTMLLIFFPQIQVTSTTLQENPLEEVNKEISNVILAYDDGDWLVAHKIIYITFSLFFKCFLWRGIS